MTKIMANRNETKRQAKDFCKKYLRGNVAAERDLQIEAKDRLFGRLLKSRPGVALSQHGYDRGDCEKLLTAHAMILVACS
jgi:hypothetical protein